MINPMGTAQDPVTGEVLPVVSTTTQLKPSTSEDRSFKVEDEEAKRRREAVEASALAAQQARATETLGVAPDAATALAAPTVAAAPAAVPTGEGATGGIRAMPTIPAQMDENNAAILAKEKEIADEKVKTDADILKRTQDRIVQWNADMASAREARAKAEKPPEEKGFLSDFFKAIASGMGAYGASMRGGENHAENIMRDQSKREHDAYRTRLDDSVKTMERLGKTREEIDGFADKERAKFAAGWQSRIDQTKAAAKSMLARFSEAQLKAQAVIAQDQAKLDAEKQAIYKDIGVSERKKGTSLEGTKQTEVTGKDGGTPKPPPQFDKTIAMHARVMDRAMTEFEGRPALTPEALEIAQKNETLLNAAIDEAKTVGSALKVNFLRDWKMIPKSATEGLSENDKIKLLNMEAINKSWLRVVSGAAIGKEEKEQNAQELTLRPGDEGEVLKWKIREIKARTADMMALSGDAGASAERANPQGNPLEPPPATKPGTAPTAAKPAQPGAKPSPAKTGNGPMRMDKFIQSLPAEDQPAAQRAFKLKPSDPGYSRAQKWLRKKGLP